MTLYARIATFMFLFAGILFAQTDTDAAKYARRETDVVRAVRAQKDAVVNISTTILVKPEDEDQIFQRFFPDFFPRRQVPAHSLGSGFIIHRDGWIITNAHVVQQANEITVSFGDKTSAKTTVFYLDLEHDLALVKIAPPKPLHALPLGRGDDLMIGETVIAIGNPLGYQHTVTVGVLSAVDRTLEFPNGQTYGNLIQTDAAINPGNSGGPLLNINGELIGINTAIRGDAQNVGFAINVEALKKIFPDLLSAERLRRIDLGMQFAPYQSDRVRVATVHENSPAQRAGFQAGDVVVGYAGKRITDLIDFYITLLEWPIGKNLNLTVQRGGQTLDIALPYHAKPKPNGSALARRHLGLVLTEVSAQDAREMGLADNSILVVERVVSGSPAAGVGIRKGDIIFQLGSDRVATLDEVARTLEPVRSGQAVSVGVMRIRGNLISSTTVRIKAQ